MTIQAGPLRPPVIQDNRTNRSSYSFLNFLLSFYYLFGERSRNLPADLFLEDIEQRFLKNLFFQKDDKNGCPEPRLFDVLADGFQRR